MLYERFGDVVLCEDQRPAGWRDLHDPNEHHQQPRLQLDQNFLFVADGCSDLEFLHPPKHFQLNGWRFQQLLSRQHRQREMCQSRWKLCNAHGRIFHRSSLRNRLCRVLVLLRKENDKKSSKLANQKLACAFKSTRQS